MEHNPYAAPTSSITADLGVNTSRVGESDQERDLRTFVRTNPSYYLNKWASAWSSSSIGFNWCAFLFTMIWLPYRKMYRITFLFYGALFLVTIAEVLISSLKPESAPTLDLIGRGIVLVSSILVGMKANGWYLAHARSSIAEVRALDLPEDDYAATLARRGGTNLLGAFGLSFLYGLAIFAVGFLIGTLGLGIEP